MHVGVEDYAGIAPLGDGLANVAVVMPLERGPRLKGRLEACFLDALRRFPALAHRLGGARLTKPILAVGPLAYRARRCSVDGARPRLLNHVARRLARRPGLADTLVGVTGDFLPPRAVLRPGYLARLFV